MNRRLLIIAVLLVVVAAAAGGYTFLRKVEVRTGELVVCTYGEIVTDTVKTVKVPARDAKDYQIKTRSVLCPTHEQVERIYASAQDAIIAKNVFLAENLISQVIKLDPDYREAQKQLPVLQDGRFPDPDTDGPRPGPVPDNPDTTDPGQAQPLNPLSGYLPASLAGYTGGGLTTIPDGYSRTYEPRNDEIDSMAITVRKLANITAAFAAIDAVKPDYPATSLSIELPGRRLAYFGTDGEKAGVLVWNDRAVLVTLKMTLKEKDNDLMVDSLRSAAQAILP